MANIARRDDVEAIGTRGELVPLTRIDPEDVARIVDLGITMRPIDASEQ